MSVADCRGVLVSYNDSSALEELERIHNDTMAFQGDAINDIDRLLGEHPRFILAHILKAAMLTQSMETRIYQDLVNALINAESMWQEANHREKGHIKAIRNWVDGDFHGAVQKWEDVLIDYPHDLLALQLIHLSDVLLGDVVGQRDCVARVFYLWNESIPGYEFLLGFYSFGLEENRDFMRAEEMSRQSLAIRPGNPYAIHAVSHVMEMQGRQTGGIAFMKEYESRWANSNFSNHLWWHTSLFHLDLAQEQKVLSIYDNHLRTKEVSGDRYEELDSAAILWRLKLLDIDVGNRWQELSEKWAPSVSDTLYAFNDVHAMMSFLGAGRTDLASRLCQENERYLEHASDANAAMSREMGLPFCLALRAFAEEDYDACVNYILPNRYRTQKLGGSFAQRDVIGWTLLEAALRAKNFSLALALANERCALKPSSPLNWRFIERAARGLGDDRRAKAARAQAEFLLAA